MLRNENLESGDGGSTGIYSPHGGGDGKICCPVAFHGAGTGEFLLHGGGHGEVSSDGEFLLVFL